MQIIVFFFFKQKTAYEMRISDWSSDVCSSDLLVGALHRILPAVHRLHPGQNAYARGQPLAHQRIGDARGGGGVGAGPEREDGLRHRPDCTDCLKGAYRRGPFARSTGRSPAAWLAWEGRVLGQSVGVSVVDVGRRVLT